MKCINHILCESKSGKSAILKLEFDDSSEKKTVAFSSVKGWRKDLALRHLALQSKDWNNEVSKMYISLQVLKCARDKHEGIKFISTVKSFSSMEIRFWSHKFLTNDKTGRAWRSFYG